MNPQLRREAINILQLNLLDNQNSYTMREDGAYIRQLPAAGEAAVNIHRDFYRRPDEAQLAQATPDGLLALLHEQAAQRLRLAAELAAASQPAVVSVEDGADTFGQGEALLEGDVENEADIAATVVDETA